LKKTKKKTKRGKTVAATNPLHVEIIEEIEEVNVDEAESPEEIAFIKSYLENFIKLPTNRTSNDFDSVATTIASNVLSVLKSDAAIRVAPDFFD